MNKKDALKVLKQYQSDFIRSKEEIFAQTLSENNNIRLFFINENSAFTDGLNIVVDPSSHNLYFDQLALRQTEEYLNWPEVVSSDAWNALCIITRAQTIHECLHVIYTDFPGQHLKDTRCNTKNKMKTMALISNIIEDAYIEAAACTVYDNIDMYLKFGRVSLVFSNYPSQGSVNKAFEISIDKDKLNSNDDDNQSLNNEENKTNDIQALIEFLNYFLDMLLFPMVKQEAPSDFILEYINSTKQFFIDGSLAASPDERYNYCKSIFDVIAPLIPEDKIELKLDELLKILEGNKTHGVLLSTINTQARKGKTQEVNTRLFVEINGKPKNKNNEIAIIQAQLDKAINEFSNYKEIVLNIVNYKGFKLEFTGESLNCSAVHKNIKVIENHPKINLNLKKAYQNIYNIYKLNINSYNTRFSNLLKAKVSIKDDKHLFGNGISSNMLGDTKKRYWYRINQGIDVPDIAILLLIDGSGSMCGSRRNAAMVSSIILHEVLQKQSISHAIVEHRANSFELEININILLDFNCQQEQKLNLMQLDADDGSRDGLALFWAEQYINKIHSDSKLIIVISDGEPWHVADNYVPPVSTKDTANAVTKITKRGTNIIAIALDDEDSFKCYDSLKSVYKNVVACNDLKRLTGQLLNLISKQIQ